MARELVNVVNNKRKNYIINSAFDIWQRGTSFPDAGAEYTADRWRKDDTSTSEANVTRVTWSSSDTGFDNSEGDYYLQLSSANTNAGTLFLAQRIENVNTLKEKTVTVKYRAKSATSETLTVALRQNFGSGGSSNVITQFGTQALTTSWAVYEATVTLPNINNKTIGADNYLQLEFSFDSDLSGSQSVDFDWIMLVEGVSASEFERNQENLSAELLACQRYYAKSYLQSVIPGTQTTVGAHWAVFARDASNQNYEIINFPSSMRIAPTITLYNSDVANDPGNYFNVSDSTSHPISAQNITESTLNVRPSVATGVNLGDVWRFQWVADAEL